MMNLELVDTILYTSKECSASIKVIADSKNNTMWTTQQLMAGLFTKNIKTIINHINNIFKSEELVKDEIRFNPKNSTDSRILIINPETQPLSYDTIANMIEEFGFVQCRKCRLEA